MPAPDGVPGAAAGALALIAAPSGHLSVARLLDAWYVACLSRELGQRPLSSTIHGIPLVLFRDASGQPRAFLDRCPHRNIPLSLGKITSTGRLRCAYHGWEFDGSGACAFVPSLCDEAPGRAGAVPTFPVRELDGLVHVWTRPGAAPDTEPVRSSYASNPRYTTVLRAVVAESTLHAAVENALDVPHTAFLHRGLFRGRREPVEITAVVTRDERSVQAEYVGEPRPPGLVARLLSPSGGVVQHWDRFVLPCVAEVEYRLGEESHFVVTTWCTPEGDTRTRLYAAVSFRLPLPGWLVRPFLQPFALRIFAQDARILRQQTAAIRRFGGERYSSTAVDVLGPQIWRLLRRAELGRLHSPPDAADHESPGTPFRREIRLRV
jgi:phenylpropionate dioxygenase-like ring-hydroxylating dioxygenase large terminal subunit